MSDACGCPGQREVERGPGCPPAVTRPPKASGSFRQPRWTAGGRQEGGRRAARGRGPQQESRCCPDGLSSPVLPREATVQGVRRETDKVGTQPLGQKSGRAAPQPSASGGDPAPRARGAFVSACPGCRDGGPCRAVSPTSCPHTSGHVCPCVQRSKAPGPGFTTHSIHSSCRQTVPPTPALTPDPDESGASSTKRLCAFMVLACKVDKSRATGAGPPEQTDKAGCHLQGTPRRLTQHGAPSAGSPLPAHLLHPRPAPARRPRRRGSKVLWAQNWACGPVPPTPAASEV